MGYVASPTDPLSSDSSPLWGGVLHSTHADDPYRERRAQAPDAMDSRSYREFRKLMAQDRCGK